MNITTDQSGQFSFEVVEGENHVMTITRNGYVTRDIPLNGTASKDRGSLIIFPSEPPHQPSIPDWVPIVFAITGGAAVIAILSLRRFR
jgi:hypothetical protein